MRKVMHSTRRLIIVILEELIELDRRTDILKFILNRVCLNDEDMPSADEESHFGVVSAALALAALPILAKGLAFAILMLQ